MNYSPFLKATFILALLFSSHLVRSQNADAFTLVNSNGKKTSFKKMTKRMNQAEVVFFGEEHNCVIAHWFTLKLLKAWTASDSLNKTFALEMFERDQQEALDSLVEGQFELKELEDHTRTWSNFETDYAPFLALALQKDLQIIAANIPRKYANLLFKQGIDSLKALPESEKKNICPLEFTVDKELSQYAQLADMAKQMGDRGKFFIEAQAIKDATMAESIVKELEKGQTVFHLNGSYHSDFQQGILWYVNFYRPNTKTITISILRQDSKKLPKEMRGKADFIIIVPTDFPVSY